jgi:hypothetical protein
MPRCLGKFNGVLHLGVASLTQNSKPCLSCMVPADTYDTTALAPLIVVLSTDIKTLNFLQTDHELSLQ